MKKFLALMLTLACILSLPACGPRAQKEEQNGRGEDTLTAEGPGAGEISCTAAANDFELTLYADKGSYTTDEEIKLWATLEYKGEKDAVTIWHGIPYITFSISDGAGFETGGLIETILTSTQLEKGKVYEFAYQKSGGFSEDDPDADFWREFYKEKSLKLPAGTYTVSVSGAFYLSEQQLPEEKGPSCELQIKVS